VKLPQTTPPKGDLADPMPPAWLASYLALSLTEEGGLLISPFRHFPVHSTLHFLSRSRV